MDGIYLLLLRNENRVISRVASRTKKIFGIDALTNNTNKPLHNYNIIVNKHIVIDVVVLTAKNRDIILGVWCYDYNTPSTTITTASVVIIIK